MKTFLLNIPQRLKLTSQGLDVQAALCDKAWTVFNDEGVKQLFIFQPDGSLFITTNGIVSNSTWKYIPANSSIIITSEKKSIMFHPAFLDDIVFALQQDGDSSCLLMIDENNVESFSPETLSDLKAYFKEKERLAIEQERRKEEEARKRLEETNKRYEEDHLVHLDVLDKPSRSLKSSDLSEGEAVLSYIICAVLIFLFVACIVCFAIAR